MSSCSHHRGFAASATLTPMAWIRRCPTFIQTLQRLNWFSYWPCGSWIRPIVILTPVWFSVWPQRHFNTPTTHTHTVWSLVTSVITYLFLSTTSWAQLSCMKGKAGYTGKIHTSVLQWIRWCRQAPTVSREVLIVPHWALIHLFNAQHTEH